MQVGCGTAKIREREGGRENKSRFMFLANCHPLFVRLRKLILQDDFAEKKNQNGYYPRNHEPNHCIAFVPLSLKQRVN